jgi:hypothetical protein
MCRGFENRELALLSTVLLTHYLLAPGMCIFEFDFTFKTTGDEMMLPISIAASSSAPFQKNFR